MPNPVAADLGDSNSILWWGDHHDVEEEKKESVRQLPVGRIMTLGFAALPPACAVRLSLTEDWSLNQVPAALPLGRELGLSTGRAGQAS